MPTELEITSGQPGAEPGAMAPPGELAGELKVRVIRRSLRCFVYGLVGCCLGGALSWQAIRLHGQIKAEIGQRWNPAARYLSWGRWLGYVGMGFPIVLVIVTLIVLMKTFR